MQWSFAGDSDRRSVSQMLIQPFVNYNLPDGWPLSNGLPWRLGDMMRGGLAMSSRRSLAIVAFAVLAALGWAEAGQAPGAGDPVAVSDVWPREFKLSNATLLVYQPQVNAWDGNLLDFRAVVAAKRSDSDRETFGVIWATARTQVDRIARMVTLEEVALTKSSFPALPDNGAGLVREFQVQLASVARRTIALDRLEASLAASATAKPAGIPVNNAPPTILVSYAPALLIPIDGAPVLQPVPGTAFERVINTRALILRPQGSSTYYLHVYDGWLYAGALDQPWYQPMVFPAGLDQVAQTLAQSGVVDLIDGGKVQPKASLASGIPAIYVSQTPTELLMFKGQPVFTPVPGTSLSWASNTANDVLLDTATREYYVLLSGRWFRSGALTGPWTFVAGASLPADFKKIPADSPAGIVLASVAGTPQAQEAVITNSIPQTATIPRVNGPKFAPAIDGPPQLQAIAGTPLQYVVNSPAPIIQVDPTTYYALQVGVWFHATSLTGPWYVAPAVPAVIYTIPPTSPLHYVTYVWVYGSTAQVVYVGYTPGYMGTVVTPDGVVVYGTGYPYPTYVGTVWYPPPVTYGVMAQPVYNPAVGMTFGFAMGVTTASAAYAWGASAYYHPAYYGYPCCGSATANVYGQYGSATYSGTRTYSSSGGTYSTSASGTYHNYATGTTGSYSGARTYNPSTGQSTGSFATTSTSPTGETRSASGSASYNPSTGQSAASYGRSYTAPTGQSASTSRSASYDAQTGASTRSGSATATGAGGRSESVSGSYSSSPGQQAGEASRTTSNAETGMSKTSTTSAATGQGASHSTTVSDSKTGQSWSHTSGQAYADKEGNVYKNSGSGWEQHGSSGWQSASKPPESVQNEEQARSQGEEKYNSFKQSGDGGWGNRAGESGGWGGRSGGGASRGGFRR